MNNHEEKYCYKKKKGKKIIFKQCHRRCNLRQTVYLKKFQTKNITGKKLSQIPVPHHIW